jgi:nicotinate-nucleotide adenylyltransferase
MRFPKLVLRSLLFLALAGSAVAGGPDLIVSSDWEGKEDALLTHISNGDLRLVNGELEFAHPNSEFLFGGDLFNLGPDSAKLLDLMAKFKNRYPERVHLVWGNHDLNILSLVAGYQRLQKAHGTPLGIVKAWQKEQALNDVLRYHQQGLAKKLGKPVSEEQAAADFLRSALPGGERFEFIRLGQIGGGHGRKFFVHGGLTDENLGVIPGRTEKYTDLKRWASDFGEDARRELDRISAQYKSGKPVRSWLLGYGDAVWDDEAKALFAESQSVIYPVRVKDGMNVRAPTDKVREALKANGYDSLLLFHTPQIAVTPIDVEGFTVYYCDTSRAQNGAKSTIDFFGDEARIRNVLTDGTAFEVTHRAGEGGMIGKLYDGYFVVGRRGDDFVLTRFGNGFMVEEKMLPVAEAKAHPEKFSVGTAAVNTEEDARRKVLLDFLNKKGLRPQTPLEIEESMLRGRKTVTLSYASKWSHQEEAESSIRAFARAYLSDPQNAGTAFITGGTYNGGEAIWMDEIHLANRSLAPEKRFKIVAFASGAAVPHELFGHLDAIAVTGFDWDSPLLSAIEVTKRRNGLVLFGGGGGVVKRGIAAAKAKGANFLLFSNLSGASQEYSAMFPERSVTSYREAKRAANSAPRKLRIGVYSGSFDPPHLGHRDIVLKMKEKFGLDLVYVVPDMSTRYKPYKTDSREVEKMTALLFEGVDGVRMLPEGANNASLQLWDLPAKVRALHADAQIFPIMGTDTYDWLSKQKLPSGFAGMTLLVNQRGGATSAAQTLAGNSVVSADLGDAGFSSTDIRKALSTGGIHEALPKNVADYAKSRGIYSNDPFAPKSVEEVVSDFKALKKQGKSVVVAIGYSGAGYEMKDAARRDFYRAYLRDLDPKVHVIVDGATAEGIGLFGTVAEEMGFEVRGVVSKLGRNYVPAEVLKRRRIYFVDDETWGGRLPDGSVSPTSKVNVAIADRVFGHGGGEVGYVELLESAKAGRYVDFTPAEMSHSIAIAKAKKAGKPVPTEFKGPTFGLRPRLKAAFCVSRMARVR